MLLSAGCNVAKKEDFSDLALDITGSEDTGYRTYIAERGLFSISVSPSHSYITSGTLRTVYNTLRGTIDNDKYRLSGYFKAGDTIAVFKEQAEYARQLSVKQQEVKQAEAELALCELNMNGQGETGLKRLEYEQEKEKLTTMLGDGTAAAEVQRQQQKVELLSAEYDVMLLEAEEEYYKKAHQLTTCKNSEEYTRAQYDACTIKAPVSGYAVYSNWNGTGEYEAFSPMVTLADEKDLCVAIESYANNNLSRLLQAGDRIKLSYGGQDYSSVVVYTPTTFPGELMLPYKWEALIGEGNVRRHILRIEGFDYAANGFEIDDPIDNFSLALYDNPDAVWIKTNSLKNEDGDQNKYYVNILVNGVAVRRTVTTGVSTGENIEILSGLLGGEEIIAN